MLESIYRSLAVGKEALSLGVDVLHPWLISGSELQFGVTYGVGLVVVNGFLAWEELVAWSWGVD